MFHQNIFRLFDIISPITLGTRGNVVSVCFILLLNSDNKIPEVSRFFFFEGIKRKLDFILIRLASKLDLDLDFFASFIVPS